MNTTHMDLIIKYLRINGGGYTEAYYVTMAEMASRTYGAPLTKYIPLESDLIARGDDAQPRGGMTGERHPDPLGDTGGGNVENRITRPGSVQGSAQDLGHTCGQCDPNSAAGSRVRPAPFPPGTDMKALGDFLLGEE